MRHTVLTLVGVLVVINGAVLTGGGTRALAAPQANTGEFRHQDPHANNQMQPPGRLSSRAPALAAVTGTPAAPASSAWTFLGPKPISGEKCCGTTPTSNFGAAAGRVTSVVVDPTNSAVAFAGSAGGGVWKTTDSGTTWSALTDAQSTLAIGALAIDATGQILYAATGEDNGLSSDQQYGLGILKSTNGGATWTLLPGTQLSGHIGGITIDRSTSGSTQHVIAATSGGIYRSTDSGATWTHVFTTHGTFDVVQDPTTATKFWATAGDENNSLCNAAVLVSTDSGATWTSNHAPASSGRISIGVGTGGVAYAAVSDCNFNLASIDKTTTGGSSWTSITHAGTPSLTNYFNATGSGQGQAWYDTMVGVDPTNSAHAVFGGVDLLATSNGGTSFSAIGKVYSGGVVHADFHAAAFFAASSFYVGNDGGVWRTSDLGGTGTAGDWTNLNSSLAITQFYSGTASDAIHFLGGTQDNGSPGNFGGSPALPSMPEYHGGDGFFTAIDPGSSTIYAEYGNGFIEKGSSSINPSDPSSPYDSFVSAGPCQVTSDPACSDNVDFIAPFVMDGSNAKHLVAGTSHVYETTNGGVPAGKSSWPQISPDLTSGLAGDDLTALTLVPGTETMFTGSKFGAVNMTTDGKTWTNITGNLPQPSTNPEVEGVPWIAQITYNPANVQELWLGRGDPYSASNNIYHTTNAGAAGGTTWTDISGSGGTALSQGPVLGMAADPNHAGTVYAGTQFGVFVCTTCGGSSPTPSWSDTGLPWVQVRQMTVSHDSSTLFAWTHGRGVWSLPLTSTPAAQVLPATITFTNQQVGTSSAAQNVTVTNTGGSALTISAATVSGTNPGDFVKRTDTCSGQSIAPTASCTVGVLFSPTAGGSRSAQLSIADNATGSPQTVSLSGKGDSTLLGVIGSDAALYVNQDAGGYTDLGGVLISTPAVVAVPVSGAPPVPMYIGIGTDHDVYIRSNTMNWQALSNIALNCQNSIGATVTGAAGSATLTVACEGSDTALWYAQGTVTSTALPTLNTWQSLGGSLTAGPAVASVGGGVTFFVAGGGGQIYSRTIAGSWTAMNATCKATPAATSLGSTAYFACHGSDDALYYATNTGSGWSAFTRAGGTLVSGPAIAVTSTEATIWVEGSDAAVYHTTFVLGSAITPFVRDGGVVQFGCAGTALVAG